MADGQETAARTCGCECEPSAECATLAERTASPSAECACRYKQTPRSDELQQDIVRRLNRAIGQLNGVKAMIDDNRYCGDVLTQLSAARSAIQSVERIVLQNHLETCVAQQVRAGDDAIIDEAVDLIMRVAR